MDRLRLRCGRRLFLADPTSLGGRLRAARSCNVLIAIAPGVMISLTVLAYNLVGDGLRDALDPRQKDALINR